MRVFFLPLPTLLSLSRQARPCDVSVSSIPIEPSPDKLDAALPKLLNDAIVTEAFYFAVVLKSQRTRAADELPAAIAASANAWPFLKIGSRFTELINLATWL